MALNRQSPAPRRLVATAAALAISVVSLAAFPPQAARAQGVEGLPYVRSVEIVGTQPCDTCPPQVCPLRPTVVKVKVELTDGCVAYRGLDVIHRRGSPTPLVVANFVVDTCSRGCPDILTVLSDSVSIPGLGPGSYSLWVESHVRSCPDTTVLARTGARPFAFDVLETCGDPPPVDSLLRSFLAFRVEPARRCAGDELTLVMRKAGCPPCLNLVSLVNDPATGITANIEWRANCVEFVCWPESLAVKLGAFAAGHHLLNVNVVAKVFNTPVADSSVAFTVPVRFEVPQICDPAPCVQPHLYVADRPHECAVTVPPGGKGAFTLSATSDVPLGGLQGHLDVSEPFRVTGIFSPPTFPGIQVSWVPEGRGARYVLFTTGGDPIPPGLSPVMTVAVAADSAIADTTGIMGAWVTLASDPQGRAVPLCDISNVRIAGVPLCVRGQSIACDANGDLLSDVRDLVLMSSCLRIDPFPGGPSGFCRDCDGDGNWAFADLLCCAQKILRLPIPPRDSVSGAGLAVTIEELARLSTGTLFRVRISGADVLGAAMLRLRYPAERWRADIPIPIEGIVPQANGWLPLSDPELPGIVHLGGLRLSPVASSALEFGLFLRPTAASQEGDELVVEGADLAANDGIAFTVPSLPRHRLGPAASAAGLELGPARPNPFTRETSFSINLATPAHVELTVHDLFGRRVATLLAERVPAGRRDVTWNAAGARDGIYFARLVVNGKVSTQRVALLRDRR